MEARAPVVFSMILTDQWDEGVTRAVGEVIIAMSQLEHVLWLGPKRARDLSMEEWSQLAEKQRIDTKCEDLVSAYREKGLPADVATELNGILERVKAVARARNGVAHGRWGCRKDGGRVVSRHRIFRREDLGVDPVILERLRDDIRAVRDDLNRFTNNH